MPPRESLRASPSGSLRPAGHTLVLTLVLPNPLLTTPPHTGRRLGARFSARGTLSGTLSVTPTQRTRSSSPSPTTSAPSPVSISLASPTSSFLQLLLPTTAPAPTVPAAALDPATTHPAVPAPAVVLPAAMELAPVAAQPAPAPLLLSRLVTHHLPPRSPLSTPWLWLFL